MIKRFLLAIAGVCLLAIGACSVTQGCAAVEAAHLAFLEGAARGEFTQKQITSEAIAYAASKALCVQPQ